MIEPARVAPEAQTCGTGPRPARANLFVAVDEEDVQTWQLGQNQGFLALMQRSWDRLHTEGGVPLAEARQRLLPEG